MNPQLNIDDLRARITGPVFTPTDDGFDNEVSGFNLIAQHTPLVVVGVTSEADVVEAVQFAARHHLPVRVLATGHGASEPVNDGLLIVTKRLRELHIDPVSHIATLGAGLTWDSVLAVAAPLGLAAIAGSSPSVGAVGLALGGGLGPLARSHGFASDYVRSFRVVTRDGEALTASSDENPDLFWALRGGKGGLGVVTEMRVELLDLPVIYAGAAFFDTEHIDAVLRGWIEWTATAPEDVTTSAAIIRFPDFDEVPEPLRGRQALALRFAYPGSAKEGKRLAAPLRALAPALMDTIGTLPTSMMGLIHSDPTEPVPVWDRGLLLSSIDQDFATALLDRVGEGTQIPLMAAEVRHLGGKTAVDVAEGSAVGGRVGKFTLALIGVPDPRLFESVLPKAVDELVSSIAPWVSPETTVNFAGRFASEQHYRSAWPDEIFDKLTAVKKLYDPRGLFTYGPQGG